MKKILLIAFVGLIAISTYSQAISTELISSGGDSFSNSNYQISWSIGEPITATFSNDNYTITQGLFQENFTITTISDLTKNNNISIYPNPTSSIVYLESENIDFENYQYSIYDIFGRLLDKKQILKETEQINLVANKEGLYFIMVEANNKIIKSFKIIKN